MPQHSQTTSTLRAEQGHGPSEVLPPTQSSDLRCALHQHFCTLDPPSLPAAPALQVRARNHRLGQRHKTTFTRLVLQDSVEEQLLQYYGSKGRSNALQIDQQQKWGLMELSDILRIPKPPPASDPAAPAGPAEPAPEPAHPAAEPAQPPAPPAAVASSSNAVRPAPAVGGQGGVSQDSRGVAWRAVEVVSRKSGQRWTKMVSSRMRFGDMVGVFHGVGPRLTEGEYLECSDADGSEYPQSALVLETLDAMGTNVLFVRRTRTFSEIDL